MNSIDKADTPLHVLHVVGPMNPGGTEVMVMELLRHKCPQSRIDFLVHVRDFVGDSAAFFNDEIKSRGARVLHILTPSRSGVLAYLRDFSRQLQQVRKPDVIHIHLNARSGIVALAAWLHGIPRIIVHSHAALTFRGSLMYRLAARCELMVSKVIFMFAATDYWGCSREAIASLFPRMSILFGKRTYVINNAIDMEQYQSLRDDEIAASRASLGAAPGDLLLGVVGRIVRHKNAAFLVSVLSVLRTRGVPAKLAFVGREQDLDYANEIRSLVSELDMDAHVVWSGERADVAAVMSALDVFASPALKEGFGLVALEAQAAGTPCVISKGFPESVDIGLRLVRFVEDFDADSWADAILIGVRHRHPRDAALEQAFLVAGFVSSDNTIRVESAYRDPDFAPGKWVGEGQ